MLKKIDCYWKAGKLPYSVKRKVGKVCISSNSWPRIFIVLKFSVNPITKVGKKLHNEHHFKL